MHDEAPAAFEEWRVDLLQAAIAALADAEAGRKLQLEIDSARRQGLEGVNLCILIFRMIGAQANQLTAKIEK